MAARGVGEFVDLVHRQPGVRILTGGLFICRGVLTVGMDFGRHCTGVIVATTRRNWSI